MDIVEPRYPNHERVRTTLREDDKPQLRSVWARVLIFGFNRDNEAFDTALLTSSPAMRAVKAGVEVKPLWANGAKIFVPGIDPKEIDRLYGKLLPHHVIAFDDDEQEILKALLVLAPRERPCLKPSRFAPQAQFLEETEEDTGGCTAVASSSSEKEKLRWEWFKFCADISDWTWSDPRICRKCPTRGQTIWGFANFYCEFWKCGNCGIRTAETWGPTHAVWSREQIIQNPSNCNCPFHKNAPSDSHSLHEETTSTERAIHTDVLVGGMAREIEWGVPLTIKIDDWK
jgi:hypothetical protein